MKLDVPSMQDLLTAGVHFGHRVSRGHPKMAPFIFGAREGVSILDLEKSEEMLKKAVEKAYELGKDGKVILLIGTKKQARGIVEELAKEADIPYLSVRWSGGLFTNFDEVRKNIDKLIGLKKDLEAGKLQRTKKEQLLIARKINKFDTEMGGITYMTKVPDAIFVVDAVADRIAITEANKMKLEVLGICDTNADPNWFTYPIPGNDDGIKAIKIVCDAVIGAYIQGKKEAKGLKEKEDAKAEADAKKAEEAVVLDETLAAEAAAIEEVVEKEIVDEQKGTV